MSTLCPDRRWPAFVLGAVTTIVVGALWLHLATPPPALAQLPDAGAQHEEIIKELRQGNRALTEIAGLLREIRDDARKDRPGKTPAATEPRRP